MADVNPWMLFSSIIFLLFLSAFFSGVETAMMSLNRYRLKYLVKENNKADNSDKIIETLETIKKKYYVLNNKLSDSDSSQSIEKIKKPNIDETNALHFSDDSKLEFSDDYLYKRPWTKLSNIHKAIKMKNYCKINTKQ